MPARVTPEELALILDTNMGSTALQGFIADAHLWVETHLAGTCAGATELVLAGVEKYLAAYFATFKEPRLKTAQFDDVAETYQRDLYVSEYLKMAASLDPCGIVKASLMDQRRPVRWRVGAGFPHSTTGG